MDCHKVGDGTMNIDDLILNLEVAYLNEGRKAHLRLKAKDLKNKIKAMLSSGKPNKCERNIMVRHLRNV